MEPDVLQKLWPIFLDQALQHISAIGEGVLRLEQMPFEDRLGVLKAIRREVHNLKGSAASLDLGHYERMAHELEDHLAQASAEGLIPERALQESLTLLEHLEAGLRCGPLQDTAPGTQPVGSKDSAPLGGQPESPAAVAATKAKPTAETETETEVATKVGALGSCPSRNTSGSPTGSPGNPSGPLMELGQSRYPALSRNAESASVDGPPVARAQFVRERVLRVPEEVVETLSEKLELLAQGRIQLQHTFKDLSVLVTRARETARAAEAAAEDVKAMRGGREHDGLFELVSRLRSLEHEMARLTAIGLHDAARLVAPAASATEALRDLRMQPAEGLVEPLRRAVREAAGRLQREAQLTISGGAVRLDRNVLDGLREPLLHLVRNAVAHGIEAPADRVALGKPPAGTIALSIEQRGHRVAVRVSDDGSGLALGRIIEAAIRRGGLTADDAKRLSTAEAARLIFRSGVSTAPEITTTSGRGVGLDAVEVQLAQMGATVDVSWQDGRGAVFELDVPILLSSKEVVIVRAAGELAAISIESLTRVLRLHAHQLDVRDGRGTAVVDGHRVSFALLSALLGNHRGRLPAHGEEPLPVLLLRVGKGHVAIGVDELLRSQSVMVQALPRKLFSAPHLSGAAVLPSGGVVGVLNAVELVLRTRPTPDEVVARSKKTRLLVTDDALTTRAALRGVLERGGFDVLTAADGEEAFGLLPGSGVKLVVSDVEMPRLDGFGLTKRIREDPRFAHLPIILVTSLDESEYQERGRAAGASGYVVKREAGRGALLKLVRSLLELETSLGDE